jgi:hypothetical protein
MKKLILLFVVALIFNSSFLINNCMSQWVQMSNGMGSNQTVRSLAAYGNAISGYNIFAGTGLYPTLTGVYLSTNNGENWTQTALNNRVVDALATLENNIFAGTDNYPVGTGGVYLSTNNGTNWTQTGLNNHVIRTLAILGTTVFTGTMDSGVYRSTNNGTNWIKTSLNNQDVLSLAVSGNNIFAGTYIGGSVYTSTDNGANWTPTVVISEGIISLAVLGNNIFAGTNGNGVYLSTNNGANWTQAGLSGQAVSALAAFGNNIFASGTSSIGIYFSSNNGTSWTSINQGFPAYPNLDALLIANNYIYAGGYQNSVWRRPLSELIVGVNSVGSEIPSEFSLSQNYPNPFNPVTKIKFDILSDVKRETSEVKLIVYNTLGKEIETLVNERLQPGTYEVTFDGSNLSSGIYFYKLTTDKFSKSKKMLMIK